MLGAPSRRYLVGFVATVALAVTLVSPGGTSAAGARKIPFVALETENPGGDFTIVAAPPGQKIALNEFSVSMQGATTTGNAVVRLMRYSPADGAECSGDDWTSASYVELPLREVTFHPYETIQIEFPTPLLVPNPVPGTWTCVVAQSGGPVANFVSVGATGYILKP